MKLLNLITGLDQRRKSLSRLFITTADITSEIDKNREIKDELKIKVEQATHWLDEKRIEVKKHSEAIVGSLKHVSDKENELLNYYKSGWRKK